MPKAKQRDWMFGQIQSHNVDRERMRGEAMKRDRSCTRSYFFRNAAGDDIKVCQNCFLSTLGYTSDSVLKSLFAHMTPTKITPPASKRGKHPPKHKLPQETVEDIRKHIYLFNPSVSHYRREHAPLRKYLPPELTIREMYSDFCERGSGLIHYCTYQKIIQSMNISFAKLGEEECEDCEAYRLHEHDSELVDNEINFPGVDTDKLKEKGLPEPQGGCNKCRNWASHIIKAEIARKAYREDKIKQANGHEEFFAADLQKVIMLPRLPGVKTAMFTRRRILFNETFAPLGGHG